MGTCFLTCGDGVYDGYDSVHGVTTPKTPNEACDDGGRVGGDGCDANCRVEADYTCTPVYIKLINEKPIIISDCRLNTDPGPEANTIPIYALSIPGSTALSFYGYRVSYTQASGKFRLIESPDSKYAFGVAYYVQNSETNYGDDYVKIKQIVSSTASYYEHQ